MKISNHTKAIFIAIFVTFLWSTSWVFIKYGLEDIPPLIYAALRYGIASLCLLPFLFFKKNLFAIKNLSRKDWILIAILGLTHYTFTQGAQFVALDHLPASMVTLLLNFTTVLVALMSWTFLSEKLSMKKWIGIAINVTGIIIFFIPNGNLTLSIFGLAIALIGVFFNAVSSLLGRSVNRAKKIPAVVITCLSMIVGSALLSLTSLSVGETMPSIGFNQWSLVIWLAVVNTAFAFTLWNISLRELTAAESSITTNTMPIQITLMVAIFYGERVSTIEIIGIVLTCVGTFLVQFNFKKKAKNLNGQYDPLVLKRKV